MSGFDSTTVSVADVRLGHANDLLAQADVVIAVDTGSHDEEVVLGRHAWELASDSGHDEDLVVLRVELDMDAGDVEWLAELIAAIEIDRRDELEDDLAVSEDEC
jgi:hypothetical protein